MTKVVQSGEDGTVITLVGDYYILNVNCGYVEALRISDEQSRFLLYKETQDIQEYVKTFRGNPLYKIENSRFLDWIAKESAGFSVNLRHFVILTEDDVVDIAVDHEISVEVAEIENK